MYRFITLIANNFSPETNIQKYEMTVNIEESNFMHT